MSQRAREYKALVDEYERIRTEAMYDSCIDDTHMLELIEQMSELCTKIEEHNKKIVESGHFIVPENEFTKH